MCAALFYSSLNFIEIVLWLYKGAMLQALDLPPQLGKPFKWTKKRDLLDVDNNGYT